MNDVRIGKAQRIHDQVLPQAYALLPERMWSDKASVMLLAIAGQESGFSARRQVNGPAKGLWQFEVAGVAGVMDHPSSHKYAMSVCNFRSVDPIPVLIQEQLANDDVLACCFARLLLWTDANALPEITDQDSSWEYYKRNWRPGKPRLGEWQRNHEIAAAIINHKRENPN